MNGSDPTVDRSDDERTRSTAGTAVEPLELLTDDGDEWTAIPADSGDSTTRWITIDRDALRPLEDWR